jgi:VWFA-related protein
VSLRFALLAPLCLTLAAPAAQTQAPPAARDATVRITAIVDAPDGRPLAGLKASDFVLSVDGRTQPIHEVTPRAPAPRLIAILLDEFHIEAADTDRVREAAHRFVEQQVREDDRVVVLKPLDSLPAIHLTSDKARMHDAIASFEGRKGNFQPRTPLEEQTIGVAPLLARTSRAQVVLSGLRALASRLGTQPGRAGIIVISDGFNRDTHLSPARALPDEGIVERFANRYDVPVYAIAPSSLDDGEPESETLPQLALQTGGFAAHGADLSDGFNRAGRELDGGYLLTFTPSEPSDGKFHPIAVQVPKKKALVRARAGYISPPSADARRALSATLSSPLLTTRLQRRSPLIQVWSGVTAFVNADGRIVVTWSPGQSAGGTTRSTATRVSLIATQPNGTVLFEGMLAPLRTAPIEGSGVLSRAEFAAPAGRIYLDMTIFGSRGEKLDVDARDLEVPAAGPALQLLPPVIHAARTVREFREAAGDAESTPDPGREFSRTTRLLIRVPTVGGSGAAADVSVRLLNRTGQTVQTLAPMIDAPAGIIQFDLQLAPYAPGDYTLQLSGGKGVQEQRIAFRVIG